MKRKRYNHFGIEKIHRANESLMTNENITGHYRYTTPNETHQNPRKLCLEHISRLQKLTSKHFRGSNRARVVAQFEREREDCLERMWKNWVKLSSRVSNELLNEGAQYNTVGLIPSHEGLSENPSYISSILEHHLQRSNNEGNISNGVYFRPSEAEPKPLQEGVLSHLYGLPLEGYNGRSESRQEYLMFAKPLEGYNGRSESRQEYLMFAKPNTVVGGRGVVTKGRKFTPASDNQPNPVKERCGPNGRLSNIAAGQVLTRYMNGGGDYYISLVGEKSKPQKQEKEVEGVQDYTEAQAELDALEGDMLLANARGYLEMSEEKFKERIEGFAAIGEAIIAEEESKLQEQNNEL